MKGDLNMKTSEAQLRASKKYLEGKERINLVVKKDLKYEIQELINKVGYYDSVPEFIRDAVNYYINLHIALGDIPSMSVLKNYIQLRENGLKSEIPDILNE